jgi:Putative peptidoglycan binding domain
MASVSEGAHAAADPDALRGEPVPVRAPAAVEHVGHGGGFSLAGILFLQRHVGNAAVARMVAGRAAPRWSGRALMRREIGEGVKGARPDAVAGDTGSGVKLLQRWLGVRETGVFDTATRLVVDAFQRQQGWEPSGVGPMTWALIEKEAGLDAPSCVFPNCFGDRLGPVGGVVIGAIAGGIALRLAAPLIVGAWRWIRIAAGVSGATAAANQDKIAMEAEELETLAGTRPARAHRVGPGRDVRPGRRRLTGSAAS